MAQPSQQSPVDGSAPGVDPPPERFHDCAGGEIAGDGGERKDTSTSNGVIRAPPPMPVSPTTMPRRAQPGSGRDPPDECRPAAPALSI
jgi:hypothetical protein